MTRRLARALAPALLAAALLTARAGATTPHALAAHTWTSVSTSHVEVLTDAANAAGAFGSEFLTDERFQAAQSHAVVGHIHVNA